MVLRLRTPAPDWRSARCLGKAPRPEDDLWFDNTDLGFEDQTELGLGVCNGAVGDGPCPVRHGCLVFALVNNERFGVWGGTSEADRRLIRKVWPWDSRAPLEPHPQWAWRSHDEIVEAYRARFARYPVKEDMDDDDED